MRWVSEWKCPKCSKVEWAQGKAAPQQPSKFIFKAVVCQCGAVMQPTGKARKTYSTTELL
jgi:hypothetical protein